MYLHSPLSLSVHFGTMKRNICRLVFHSILRWSMPSVDLEMNWNAFNSSVIYKVCFSDRYSLYLGLLAVNEINSALEIMLVASRDEREFKR